MSDFFEYFLEILMRAFWILFFLGVAAYGAYLGWKDS